MSEAMPATGIAGILAAPGSCARPSRAVPPGSVAELSCQKIIFDLQLADLPVQMIDLGLIAGSLRRTTTLEDACRTVQQLLLPVVDLVRVDPELPTQLGDGPVAPDGRQRHLRLEHRAVLLPCPLHVLLPRYPRFLGAGLHLSHLSHFRGPPQWAGNYRMNCADLASNAGGRLHSSKRSEYSARLDVCTILRDRKFDKKQRSLTTKTSAQTILM